MTASPKGDTFGIRILISGFSSRKLESTCFNGKEKEGAMALNISSTSGRISLRKGRFFSISVAKAKSRAAGVFRGGVLEWPPLPRAVIFTSM